MNTRLTFPFLRIALGLVLFSSLVLGEVTPASATGLHCYVRANASGSNTGTSWTNAYTNLQLALNSTSSCTEVWVAKGTYKPTTSADPGRTASFRLKNGVAIYGGFAGTETLLTQRKPAANPTILSGEIDEAGPADNSYHVVVGSGTNSTARLDGFTITAGNAAGGSSVNDSGGGIYNDVGNPSFVNIILSGNLAQDYGGGMYNWESSPILTNVTFSDNSAGIAGGMYNYYQSSPSLVNVTFSGNSAYSGGGMLNDESSPTLTNVTFSGNSATSGGGIYNSNSSPIIKNSILYGDTGGEISNDSSSSPVVTYSIIQGGYAGTGNLNANPRLGPLANNGGFTKTMMLGYGSPAIDSGTSTGCPAKDQRGLPRPQDGDINGTATCDMGATEARFSAGRCYVNVRAAGFNDGMTWQDAYRDLQSALGTSPCTAVWVAKGTYKPTTGTDRMISFVLKNGAALYGGFAGTETLLTERNPAANPTILSGNIATPGNLDNSYHVVLGSGTNSTTRLDGFTITGGNANGAEWPDYFGGGMYSETGSPSLVNLTFSDNQSSGDGGGMYNDDGSSPSLVNLTFSDNQSSGNGGGMYNLYSNPSLLNVTFSDNLASELGGGMCNENSSNPSLTNVTFSGNSANYGGGMYNNNSSPQITNSILYDAGTPEIFNSSSSPVVTYSIVKGGFPGTGNLDANPLLKPLADNGGFTKTMMLGIGSPAIDKGTNTGCPAKDQRGKARPQDGDADGTAICDMGATEFPRLLSATFRSAGAQDGWVLESTETSGLGGETNSTYEYFSMGDFANDRQIRSILSFNTAGLPDTAVITSAILKIKKHSLVGDNPFLTFGNILVDVRKGSFSNNAALEVTDFQAAANKQAAMTILNNPVSGWYSKAMAAANFVYINKTGLTQFRLRFAKDDNDDGNSDYLRFYSGNYGTAAYRPALIIKYYAP